ncbi:MAG: ATP-binding protein [Bacteriovoracaceae bacterium]
MTVNFSFVNSVRNDFYGFGELASLQQQASNLMFDDLYLDFSSCSWFEANLSAPLGAILNKATRDVVTIHFNSLPPGVETILRKNEFLTYYGYGPCIDTYGTCVKYSMFNPNDSIGFKDYIEKELFAKHSLPNMSDGLTKKIKETIIEVFTNTGAHGGTDRVFCCGQIFPQSGRLDFTIANLGRTFNDNISNYLGQSLSDVDAIDWGTQKDNSTRVGAIPGGLGLYTLLSFLSLNNGKVQIISGDGCWTSSASGVTKNRMASKFQGSIVNIEFNINDRTNYVLSTELEQKDIF